MEGRNALRLRVERHNSICSAVEPGTEKHSQCETARTALLADLKEHAAASKRFEEANRFEEARARAKRNTCGLLAEAGVADYPASERAVDQACTVLIDGRKFDTPRPDNGGCIQYPQFRGMAYQKLLAKIPLAKIRDEDMPRLSKELERFQKLDGDRTDIERQISQIKENARGAVNAGGGDVLAKLTAQRDQLANQELLEEKEIKRIVVEDLHLEWNEEPAPASPAQATVK
jgi:hypothetical protein